MRAAAFLPLILVAIALSGCELLGDSPEKLAGAKEADGKAIGSACRHAGRAIEDCYALNKKAEKSAVFTGWREMNDYMRENKIEVVKPELPPPNAPAKVEVADEAHDDAGDDSKKASAAKDDKPASKAAAKKPAAKH